MTFASLSVKRESVGTLPAGLFPAEFVKILSATGLFVLLSSILRFLGGREIG